MNLIEQLKWRYATKKFDPSKKVTEAVFQQILEAGNLTATSFGLQAYKFVVVRNPATRAELVAHSWNQKQIEEASHLLVLAARTDIDAQLVKDYVSFVEQEREMEAGALSQLEEMMLGFINRDAAMNEQWAAKQLYIVLGTLLDACAMENVDACPMEGFDATKYDEILGLKEKGLKSVLALPIGYRSAEDHHQNFKKVRRPLKDMIVEI